MYNTSNNSISNAIEETYKELDNILIIGLTGRTGAGCSTVAAQLEKEFKDLDLKSAKEYDYTHIDERKDYVIRKFMSEPDRWIHFDTIEVSSIILACVLQEGKKALTEYIERITSDTEGHTINIGDKDKLLKLIDQWDYMFTNACKYSLSSLPSKYDENHDLLKNYYNFYIKDIKQYKIKIKDILENYACYDVTRDKMNGKTQKKHHLYTFLMQRFGNNIRSSGSPFIESFDPYKLTSYNSIIDNIIKIIVAYDNNVENKKTRICIDAIRNPYEAMYFRDKYKAFYLMAISTADKDRTQRLNTLSSEELLHLDEVEYAQKLQSPQEVFYHQNISGCLEIADIHIYNPNIDNGKYYELTTQLLKYVALMIHPGLVTPTHIERCMQLAYNAKYNSGCLSRQVGATVTRSDFSVQAIGWNDVPKGQISCNLRDVSGYCTNKDCESYSDFELKDKKFNSIMYEIHNQTLNKTKGHCMAYCFKDIYNGIKNDKNQVYTRALHAEENAFLQISKYGGTEVKGGCLFTTASPCELCAKKAYQLGIKHIYYIDPYPGISESHILTFGNTDNPQMHLFYGAIGSSYLRFYTPRVPIKDELEMITSVSIKQIAQQKKTLSELPYNYIEYNNVDINIIFDSRGSLTSNRAFDATVTADKLEYIQKRIIWTGGTYEGTKICKTESDADIRIEELDNGLPHSYNIIFDNGRKKGDTFKFKIETNLRDEKSVMEPYLAHMVKHKTDSLKLTIRYPKGIISNIKKCTYADLDMKTKISSEICNANYDNECIWEISHPNVNYTYALEWDWTK